MGRFLSQHAGAVVGWIISAFMLVVSLILSTPGIDQLVEVSGTIRSAVEITGGRTPERGVIFTLDDRADRYWTRALAERPAGARARSLPGSFVRAYVEKTSAVSKAYGAAQETWGLSIDGETVQAVGDALSIDRARKHVLLPLMALVLAAVSSIGFVSYPKIGHYGYRHH